MLGRRQALQSIDTTQSTEQRGLLSGLRDLAAHAKTIATGIATFAVALPTKSDNASEQAQQAQNYADMVSQTEIHGAVQSGAVDLYNDYGLPIVWIAESGACPVCLANADDGVHAAGVAFPSGDEAPPAHPRCRCHVARADLP